MRGKIEKHRLWGEGERERKNEGQEVIKQHQEPNITKSVPEEVLPAFLLSSSSHCSVPVSTSDGLRCPFASRQDIALRYLP